MTALEFVNRLENAYEHTYADTMTGEVIRMLQRWPESRYEELFRRVMLISKVPPKPAHIYEAAVECGIADERPANSQGRSFDVDDWKHSESCPACEGSGLTYAVVEISQQDGKERIVTFERVPHQPLVRLGRCWCRHGERETLPGIPRWRRPDWYLAERWV